MPIFLLDIFQISNQLQNSSSPLSWGDYQWHTFYGSPGGDLGQGIALDGNGGVYIVGYSVSSWNGPAGQSPLHAYTALEDITVIKLDSSGAYQWHTFYGSTNMEYGNGIAVDGSSGVYVVARSSRAWDGPLGQAPLHAYAGYDDITLLKLDTSGVYQWHTFYGSTDMDFGNAVVPDGNGGVFITGSSESSWNGPAGQVPLHSHIGSDDFAVLKLNTSGGYQWHTFYGSSDGDWAQAIALDGGGGLYIAGTSQNSWNGAAGQPPLHSYSGSNDIAVLKLDESGAYQHHTFYGSQEGDWGFGIALDCRNGVYITGTSEGSWTGPAGQAPLNTHSGNGDILVFKLDSALAYQWHTFYGSTDYETSHAITAGGSGVVIAAKSHLSWNGPAGQAPLHAHSGQNDDITVFALDNSGNYQWHTFYGKDNMDLGTGIAVDGGSWIYVTGYSYGPWNGPGDQPPLHGYTGFADIPVLKLQGAGTGSEISGNVALPNGNPLPGVVVSAGLGCKTTTDMQGNYLLKDVAVGMYTVTPRLNGYIFTPPAYMVSLPPDAINRDFTGHSLIADISFRPNPDGYNFTNYTGGNLGDYTSSELRRMFGDSAVCFLSAPSCAVRSQAGMWHDAVTLMMPNGRSYGMSVSSLRFFKDLDLIPDASIVYGLSRLSDVSINWNNETFTTTTQRNIGFFSMAQYTDPVHKEIGDSFTYTPEEILAQLQAAMSNGDPIPLTLLLDHKFDNGKTEAHAITPYALTNTLPDEWSVWVYDSNYPDDASRYLSIDTNENNWDYDLGGNLGIWSGDALSYNLGVIATSIHNQQMQCPWCSLQINEAATTHSLMMNGGGHLLVTDSQGRRLGFVGSQYIDEVPAGYGITPILGSGDETEPVYTLPLTETYTILIDGQVFPQTNSAELVQFGPGYAVMVNHLTVSQATHDQLSISNDGTQLTYQASQDQSPTLSMGLDSAVANYGLEIRGVDIAGGKAITLSADPSAGDLILDNSQSSGGAYNLYIQLLNPHGKAIFYHGDIPLLAADTHIISFGAWDGFGTIILEIDHDSNGSIDETIELNNQMRYVLLPTVRLNR